MAKKGKIKWLPVLMVITILAITAFQVYWLRKAYEREERNLEMRTNFLFRDVVRSVQASKLKLEGLLPDSGAKSGIGRRDFSVKGIHINSPSGRRMAGLADVLMQRLKDSTEKAIVLTDKAGADTLQIPDRGSGGRRNRQKPNHGFAGSRDRLMQFLFDVDSLQEPVTVQELDTAYAAKLKEQGLEVPFHIKIVPTKDSAEPSFNQVTLGFAKPVTYRLKIHNRTAFVLKRISVPILFSVFLIGFTLLSFTLLYRNLLRQQRLSDIKNEFISNITHELKTPIATVSVAIEALRSFNASMDAERTREYLDISANELQRLSLLVDKVLKLSMFEKQELELKYEWLDMKSLAEEVTASMRLQAEKHRAVVTVKTEGDTTLEGDRLHLVSVIFNLLDNALKYSAGEPVININIKESGPNLLLVIKDKGIGIPAEYQSKVFEKFFRVPTGNLHNAKGYGLGLSYVAHVIQKHGGTIKVESAEGAGSSFIISLPKKLNAKGQTPSA